MARKRQKQEPQAQEEPEPVRRWIDIVTEDQPTLAVPVGPRFQANVPDFTDPSDATKGPSTEKWLGEQVLRAQDDSNASRRSQERTKRTKEKRIGKGWLEICSCRPRGSAECVERHVNEARMELKEDLGTVYESWKLHEIEDVIFESWSKEEEETFRKIVKENPISEGEGFMKPALKALPSKNRANIVSYYMNVYIPRRIAQETRAGKTNVGTDDESDDEDGSSSRSRGKKESSKQHISYLSGRR